MSIETKKLLYISIKRIEEDIIISSENLVDENQFLLDISLVKICGMETDSALLIHMEISLKTF
jgi:hypothetical protein